MLSRETLAADIDVRTPNLAHLSLSHHHHHHGTDPIFHIDQQRHQSSIMGELRSPGRFASVSDGPSSPDTASTISSPSFEHVTTPPVPPLPPYSLTNNTLIKPSHKNKRQKTKLFGAFRSVFRSFPIMSASCKFPVIPSSNSDCHHPRSSQNGTRVTGTLYGYRKGRVILSVQETPRCVPSVVIELPIQTTTLQKEMGAGMVRIALECEKRPEKEKTRLLDEPLWTMFCNGKKSGYGVRRDPTEEDLMVMQIFRAVSMGAGVIPGSSKAEGADDELTYFRSQFEHVVGSKDSETLYMLSPEGNYGPELTMFFVRI